MVAGISSSPEKVLQARVFSNATWRECIRKVWEIDPLECPKCDGETKIVRFIDKPSVIRHILEHLGLWREEMPKGLSPPEETISGAGL